MREQLSKKRRQKGEEISKSEKREGGGQKGVDGNTE